MLKVTRSGVFGYAFVYRNKNDFNRLKNEITKVITGMSPDMFFENKKSYKFCFRYHIQNDVPIITVKFTSSTENKQRFKLKLDKPGIILFAVQPPYARNEYDAVILRYVTHLYNWNIENATSIIESN